MNWAEIPNLRHLRAVEAIARLGSVSRASAHIHVSQPAVTQAIAKLEGVLGITLFDRRATGSFPTDLGKIFVRRVARFFDMADRALVALWAAHPEATSVQGKSIEHIATWTQIRSLIATTDPHEVEERAREIGVSAGSLYRSARELEQALDIQLFRRRSTGLMTTVAATEFARQLAVATREIEYGIEEVVSAEGRSAGRINIGVLPMSGSFALADAVNAMMRDFPSIQFKIFDGTYLPHLRRLRSGHIDLIFGLLRGDDSPDDVVEEELFSDQFCVAVRQGHPLTRLAEPTPADLAEYEWIAPSPGTLRRQVVERLFDGLVGQPRFGVETSALTVMRTLLTGSDRLGILSRSEFELERHSGLLCGLPVNLGQGTSKGIATRYDWLPTPTHELFLAHLRRCAAQHNAAMGWWPISLSPRLDQLDEELVAESEG